MDRFMEQVAIEASQMYVTEDGKSRFANTVGFIMKKNRFLANI